MADLTAFDDSLALLVGGHVLIVSSSENATFTF